MTIFIYRGDGVFSRCLSYLLQALHQEGVDRGYDIRLADGDLVRQKSWQSECALLIFPGGRDVPYHRALCGLGNERILEFVHDGGRFLGICAGAYYGCANVDFERGTSLEVVAERELKFFPGVGRGPAYGVGTFQYNSIRGARVANIALADRTVASYYHGGCTFVDADTYPTVAVIARYMDLAEQPPAVVECTIGHGRAILSGVHPEYSGFYSLRQTRRDIDRLNVEICTALQRVEQKRRILFKHILNRLGL